ncbi:FAD-binding domain-containing protein [Mollisia scopiformis]|uniref:FAD-binding domain-containing protein n=1 Tax=Mollisia scopiformis TaxID=149040 RepID=A0A194XKQ2_MOLSC|nr:FAD-binding domain-containing protein [Mollisia scopiformis]KUJ20738.1 FAD-binding domain-containing protein [Mollisia scopiformis]
MLQVLLPVLVSAASAAILSSRQTLSGSTVCEQIAGSINGTVYYPTTLSDNFVNDTEHYMSSSSETPTCVVEVASPEDVSSVLSIVGQTRTPFAIKSGGHASNPGFSSTTGVFISLVRINQVTLSADKSTVEVGLGNVWTDVYTALDGSDVNVVGGRVIGPGVGGFSLGGGYSWLTDQYGLTCDTVQAFNLVLPNGTITQVDSAQSDLFFALKGGLNRFGIVTSIIFKTVPQTNDVYGGIKLYGTDAVPDLITATNTFQDQNTDPKAQVILTLNGGSVPGAILLLFYDGPEEPAAFAPYNNVSAAPLISTVKSQSYASFSTGTDSDLEAGYRGAFHTMMTTSLTTAFLTAVYNETTFYGDLALLNGGNLISYDVEPFLNYGQYATDSAFPHANSPLPLNLYYSWTPETEDEYWRGVMQQSIDHLIEVAKAEGIFTEDAYAYPNYALSTYSGAQLYGPTNAARLREIQATYDPNGVMTLAGGFTF